MKYSEIILEHFFSPRNVGLFDSGEKNVGSSVMGSYENGALIHFQIKVDNGKISGAKFKAYGSCPIIATCSYVTQWVKDKSLEEASQLTALDLLNDLEIPKIKIHCALLVEDALKAAIDDYKEVQS